jgi:hypothetical protein
VSAPVSVDQLSDRGGTYLTPCHGAKPLAQVPETVCQIDAKPARERRVETALFLIERIDVVQFRAGRPEKQLGRPRKAQVLRDGKQGLE